MTVKQYLHCHEAVLKIGNQTLSGPNQFRSRKYLWFRQPTPAVVPSFNAKLLKKGNSGYLGLHKRIEPSMCVRLSHGLHLFFVGFSAQKIEKSIFRWMFRVFAPRAPCNCLSWVSGKIQSKGNDDPRPIQDGEKQSHGVNTSPW